MTTEPRRYGETLIFPAALDPDAVAVIRRLQETGHEAYLVGGCVRDLLLGHIPKDFDVSTSARPRQIRRLFRNSRIIGRRFQLVHVYFGPRHEPRVVEVATFRRTPEEESSRAESDDLLIVRDNEFGNAEEDVVRRDFTINALLYDIPNEEVIDYVGGVEDLKNRVLRTIGDPETRIKEDPVRMLRAARFGGRLGLSLDQGLETAMAEGAELIDRSAPPRVLEEIYKLLTCGAAGAALDHLSRAGLLGRLFPEVADYWTEHADQLVALGRALDAVDGGRRSLPNGLMLALLFGEPWRASLEEGADPVAHIDELVQPAARRMNIPRRDMADLKLLVVNQLRLERDLRRKRRMRMSEFLARPATQASLTLLYLRCLAGLADPEIHERWAMRMAKSLPAPAAAPAPGDAPPRAGAAGGPAGPDRPRRRRRRRGGRGRSRRPEREAGAGETSAGDDEKTTAPAAAPALAAVAPVAESPDDAQAPATEAESEGLFAALKRGVLRLFGRDTEPVAEVAPDEAAAEEVPGKEAPPEGEAPRRRRRRRGGRRHRGRREGGQPAGPESGSEPAKEDGAGQKDEGAAGSRPRRRRRSGQRGSGDEQSQKSAGRGRRGSRGRDEGSRGGRRSRPPAKEKTSESTVRRAPEDVEDLFDW